MTKLGYGYYSLSRVRARFLRAQKKADGLRELERKVYNVLRERDASKVLKKALRLSCVLNWRAKGMTFTQIAEKLEVTRQRAIQLHQEALALNQAKVLCVYGSSLPQVSKEHARRNGG